MKRRIKELLVGVSSRAAAVVTELSQPTLSQELLEAIMADLEAHKTHTYDQVAAKLGCSPEKIRLESKNIPGVIRASKPHRVTETAYRLLVERLAA